MPPGRDRTTHRAATDARPRGGTRATPRPSGPGRPPPRATAVPLPPSSTSVTCPLVIAGNTTLTVSTSESTTSTATTAAVKSVSHRPFTPRPEHRPVRAQETAGTPSPTQQQHPGEHLHAHVLMRRPTAPGHQHHRGGECEHPGEHGVEALRVPDRAVQRVPHAEHVPEGVRRRQPHGRGADDGRVDERDREPAPRRGARPRARSRRRPTGVREVPGAGATRRTPRRARSSGSPRRARRSRCRSPGRPSRSP